MKRFSNILLVCDPISHALPALQRALELARKNDAKITLANIREKIPGYLSTMKKTFIKLQNEELDSLISKLATDGVDIELLPLTGTPFIEIIQQVNKNNYDLVIKPSEGKDGISSMLFGSTDLHLMRKCPCPVWIIKPQKQLKFDKILAPIDPSPDEQSNEKLNNLILQLSSSLAKREKCELHILHVWSMNYENQLRNSRFLPRPEIEEMVKKVELNHKLWMDKILANYNFDDISVKIHFVKGEAAEKITSTARAINCDLIVMGTVARTGIPGFFIGNTAEQVLSDVDCSILAVKPDTFLTPVD